MFIGKIYWRNNKFRITFIILFVLAFYLLSRITNRLDFGFIIISFPTKPFKVQNETYFITKCTNIQSQKHGELFASFPPIWSGCYNDFYLKAFEDHHIPVEILVDVGANKAYAIATWLAFFLPELNITQAYLGEYIRLNKNLPSSCGSCDDCKDESLKRKNFSQKMKLQMHAFEPQPGTVDVLKDIKNWMNISDRSLSTLDIHGMAVSDEVGQNLFRKCNPGNEVCSLDISGVSTDEQIYVNVTTLDHFTHQNHLSKIDILKVDTEGYEPLVFQGAKHLLQEHRIRLFIFEHLKEGAWRNTSLEKEVSNLTLLGYVCYIIGKTGLIRVSYCWNEKYDVRHSNILCVSSKDNRLMDNIDQLRLAGTMAATVETNSARKNIRLK